MAKDRVPIPDDLAAAVLFASDRTCCVCRVEKLKTQIHHIDEDSSNNTFDNLAVICLNCHSEAHTNFAFVRNLTPELVHLYNSSWREMVKLKIRPQPEALGKLALAAEGYLEASLDCHIWKRAFMEAAGPDFDFSAKTIPMGEYQGVWFTMATDWLPAYSADAFVRFLPLFRDVTTELQSRFDRIGQLFADVLVAEFRAELVRANRRIEMERLAYLQLPLVLHHVAEDQHQLFFSMRFAAVAGTLGNISQEADRRRELLAQQVQP